VYKSFLPSTESPAWYERSDTLDDRPQQLSGILSPSPAADNVHAVVPPASTSPHPTFANANRSSYDKTPTPGATAGHHLPNQQYQAQFYDQSASSYYHDEERRESLISNRTLVDTANNDINRLAYVLHSPNEICVGL